MALTKVLTDGVKDDAVTADKLAVDSVISSNIVNGTIDEVKLDVSNTPTAGHFLQYKDNSDQLTWAQASSPEVYGFNTNASGHLTVTTTNGGADNISGATYAAFEDVIFAATGFTFTVNTDGKLIATI